MRGRTYIYPALHFCPIHFLNKNDWIKNIDQVIELEDVRVGAITKYEFVCICCLIKIVLQICV